MALSLFDFDTDPFGAFAGGFPRSLARSGQGLAGGASGRAIPLDLHEVSTWL